MWWGQYRIYDDDGKYTDLKCDGDDLVKCIENEESWYILDDVNGTYDLHTGLNTSDCDNVDAQCINVDYDYCLDIDDESSIYSEYEGMYQLDGCDNNGYPLWSQYTDINGEIIIPGIIQFDVELSYFNIDGSLGYIYFVMDYC